MSSFQPAAATEEDHRVLLSAAATGRTDALLELVTSKTGLALSSVTDIRKSTALHLAAKKGHHTCVATLLAYGGCSPSYINARNSFGQTPLHCAVFSGCSATVTLLLNAQADCNIADAHGRFPAHIAVAKGLHNILQALIQNGAQDPGDSWPSGSKRYDLSRFWTPDSEARTCMCCLIKNFTWTVRRHHCRQCGDVVCDSCTKKAKPPWHTPVGKFRVCLTCYNTWAGEGGSKHDINYNIDGVRETRDTDSESSSPSKALKASPFSPETEAELQRLPYFDGKLDRKGAEDLLRASDPGSFIMRPSSHLGCIALSINTPKGILHRLIKQSSDHQWYLVDDRSAGRYTLFPNVNELIIHFQNESDKTMVLGAHVSPTKKMGDRPLPPPPHPPATDPPKNQSDPQPESTSMAPRTIMSQINCPGCSALVPESFKFCFSCGFNLQPAVASNGVPAGAELEYVSASEVRQRKSTQDAEAAEQLPPQIPAPPVAPAASAAPASTASDTTEDQPATHDNKKDKQTEPVVDAGGTGYGKWQTVLPVAAVVDTGDSNGDTNKSSRKRKKNNVGDEKSIIKEEENDMGLEDIFAKAAEEERLDFSHKETPTLKIPRKQESGGPISFAKKKRKSNIRRRNQAS